LRGFGKAGVVEAIREAGGEIYAITSEPQSLANSAQQDWNTGFGHIGDPHQEISGMCAQKGWLSLFTNEWANVRVADWASHPKGYFQPGVLALNHEGRVLYRWRSRPTRKNIGGAVSRPTPGHVWKSIQDAFNEDADAAHDDNPELDSPGTPWSIFVTLLLANGWFLKPAVFNHRPGEGSVSRRIRQAALRVPIFLAAWIVAAILLPPWVVALAFAAWIAIITPGVLKIHRRFQNVSQHDEPTEIG